MGNTNDYLTFSMSAVFIGANFGLAALVCLEKIFEDFSKLAICALATILLLAAFSTLASSQFTQFFFNLNTRFAIAHISVICLAISYLSLLVLGIIAFIRLIPFSRITEILSAQLPPMPYENND